jgi:predicted DNA-binding transcriptional regulator AlpA
VLKADQLTRAEVAELTGLSVRVLADMAFNGKGPPYYRLSRKMLRYSRPELLQWIEDQHHVVRVAQT